MAIFDLPLMKVIILFQKKLDSEAINGTNTNLFTLKNNFTSCFISSFVWLSPMEIMKA